jgi:hypothetical protein
MHLLHLHRKLGIFLALILLLGCNKESAPDCFKRAGNTIQEAREVAPFTRIETNDFLHIELKQSPEFKVEVTGPKNILPKVLTEVENGVLRIENTNTCNFVRSFNKPITLRIHAPFFEEIINNGTGNIRILDTLRGPFFFLENNDAAGVFEGRLECDTITIISHTGVSDVNISGEAKRFELFAQGLGKMNASQLHADVVLINNSSINEVYVWAEQYLFAFIGSKGNVYYSPSDADIEEVIEGTGRVVPF